MSFVMNFVVLEKPPHTSPLTRHLSLYYPSYPQLFFILRHILFRIRQFSHTFILFNSYAKPMITVLIGFFLAIERLDWYLG